MRQPRRRTQASPVSIPAPVAGIVENIPPGYKEPTHAEYVENFLPTVRGLRVRGGTQQHADVGSAVLTLATYKSGAAEQMFAATATDIYDVTTSTTEGTSLVGSLTSGNWSFQQIGTSGGQFLIGVNGADAGQLYDGSTWSAASITGVAYTDLKYVWSHINRLFFVQKDTLKSWYLPAGSIAGAALEVDLSGVFQRGGSLLFGDTWSLDSGDGMDDKCVFVSSEGEVAIYSGTDPSSAATWALEGLFEIGKPLSARAHIRIGGDLLIATDDGIIPLSAVFTKDSADLSLSAVSRTIQTTWRLEAARASERLQLVKWTAGETMLVVLPDAGRTLTANLQTRAWAVQTGWDGDCAAELSGGIYVGTSSGVIKQIDVTGADMGLPFTAKSCPAFEDLGSPTLYKSATLMRGKFLADTPFKVQYFVAKDFNVKFPPAPSAEAITSDGMVWGTDNWGEKQWQRQIDEASTGFIDRWKSVSGSGQELAPGIQITSGSATKMAVEYIGADLMVEVGGMVT